MPAQIQESNKYFAGMLAVLAGCTLWLGPLAMLKLYAVPYWINVMWLDAVTYLHHHGPDDENIKVPWYRGEVGWLLLFLFGIGSGVPVLLPLAD